MFVLVNAMNHGRPLGGRVLGDVRRLGAHGVRTDVWPEGAEAQLREFARHPDLQLLALVHGGPMGGDANTLVAEAHHAATIAARNLRMTTLPNPPFFELGNEPETLGNHWEDPDYFGQAVVRAARAVWRACGPDTLVVSGGVHNPDRKTQQWLKRAARHFPRGEGWFAVGFHNYAPGMGDPDVPQRGFSSLAEQVASLEEIGYPIFDTESGGHTGPTEGHRDEEVARWLRRRLELSRHWGLVGSVVYQLHDAPILPGGAPHDHEGLFGLLRADGSWKPSGHALRRWIRGHPDPRRRTGRGGAPPTPAPP